MSVMYPKITTKSTSTLLMTSTPQNGSIYSPSPQYDYFNFNLQHDVISIYFPITEKEFYKVSVLLERRKEKH